MHLDWATTRRYGLMAEWLGRGLQNLVQRFESASDLEERLTLVSRFFVVCRGGILSAPSLDRLWLRVVAASLCKHRRNTTSKPLLRSMAQMNKSSRTAHLGNKGCGDRGSLLLDLRSALYSISASSGVALHFESASDLEERLTLVSRFFLCWWPVLSAPSPDRLWLRGIYMRDIV